MKIKALIKRFLFIKKGLKIDNQSSLNFNVEFEAEFHWGKIRNSELELRSIGNGCYIENTVTYGNIFLGNHVSISGPGTILHSGGGAIKIGNYVSIAQNVSIQEFNHSYKRASTYAMNFFFFSHDFKDDVVSKGDIIIEDDVWIGSNAVILSGVTIGRGAVIAAGSIVTKNIPPYSIAMGCPARVVKKRFSEEKIKYLENSEWWNWSDEKILKNKDFFINDLE